MTAGQCVFLLIKQIRIENEKMIKEDIRMIFEGFNLNLETRTVYNMLEP